jgi:hypothetical protein
MIFTVVSYRTTSFMLDEPPEQMRVQQRSNKRYRKLRNYKWRIINFSLSSSQTALSLYYLKAGQIRFCIRNDQQYALICTTPLFYVLAATCFGSSLPSSGSFLDPSELLEMQIGWVVYHIICGYVATWSFLIRLITHDMNIKLNDFVYFDKYTNF